MTNLKKAQKYSLQLLGTAQKLTYEVGSGTDIDSATAVGLSLKVPRLFKSLFMTVNKNSYFWQYLSQPIRDLILEGEFLRKEIIKERKYDFKDYSFLVFPFAKAYEGFLKKIFLDVGFISRVDYISDHFRLGKVLSANLVERLGERSVYKKIVDFAGEELADKIWNTWKSGRNQVFHFFPHNLKSLSFTEAEEIIGQIMETMEETATRLKT